MNKKRSTLCALFCACALIFTLTACGSTDAPAVEAPPEETAETPVEQATPPDSESEAVEKTLVAGYDFFTEKFSPFFSKTAYDQDAALLTQIGLIDGDRSGNVILNGSKKVTIPYNGSDYEYDTASDIDIVKNDDGSIDYNVSLRNDLVFSDGTPITIDDVIFNMYVYSDPAYDGSATFYSLPIIGIKDYRAGVNSAIYEKYETMGKAIFATGPENKKFSDWTKEQQDAFWGDCLTIGGTKFAQEIVDYCAANYASGMGDVFNSEVANGMANWSFGEVDDSGVMTAPSGATFDLKNGKEPTSADYWNEIVTSYGLVFEKGNLTLDAETAGTPIADFVVAAFISQEGPKDPEAGGDIDNIAGIKKTGDYSCTVTTEIFEASSIYQFSIPIAPLHYYGDKSQYDYDNNKFGFPKGDLSIVKSKTTTPMGAGPYKYISYENGVVSYEANDLYYKGAPKTKYVRFQETSEPDKVSGVKAGTFDLANPTFSNDTVASIQESNSNGEMTGDIFTSVAVDALGYGYIGINANNICVNKEPNSDASIALRSAFATILAVYRDTVINSYYGPRASVVQYPISNTSWAAPKPNDEGYRIAYSKDAEGKELYTDGMSEKDKEAAALNASIEFFKKAGYKWDEATSKFTGAPKGAEMAYEIIVAGDGSGTHPSFGILTSAKEALATIGITLEINDPTADNVGNVLWGATEGGTVEMWCAFWESTPDPDMYQVYHSSNIVGKGGTDSNIYGLASEKLDELIIEARQSDDQSFRKATYKQCLDIILESAVEVPVYQRQNALIFSTERINTDTLIKDMTTFYKWYAEIENIEMN